MRIGFIGGGNMAGAIINGIVSNRLYDKSEIAISDPNETIQQKYQDQGYHLVEDNCTLVACSDIIVLAVKPNIYPFVLKELTNSDLKEKLFISIAIGKSVAEIKSIIGTEAKVIRTMPNTPASVGEGMTVLAEPDDTISESDFTAALAIFQAIGKTEVLPERLLNSVGSVSGSSPAYVFLFIEAMADAAVRDGIPRKTAYTLAAQSVLGSAKMVLESGMHPGELKDMVCSPGGTTITAVQSLEKSSFRGAVMEAMERCTEKANNM